MQTMLPFAQQSVDSFIATNAQVLQGIIYKLAPKTFSANLRFGNALYNTIAKRVNLEQVIQWTEQEVWERNHCYDRY